jgi:thymidylate synthase
MQPYLDALTTILTTGEDRGDRTGVGTKSVFGMQQRYNLTPFPAVTTKKLAWKAVVSELLWFMEGSTDERRLCEILYGTRDKHKTTIWTANANAQGAALGLYNTDTHKELGKIYGKQWRDWNGVDQLADLITGLRTSPYSRRHILSAWNVSDIPDMALPPCHIVSQFYVSTSGKLSCHLYQRSADFFLGVPFNIASYALLTHILANITGLGVGELIHTTGDAHIYANHIDQVNIQLSRTLIDMPTLSMPAFTSLNDVLACSVDDFKLVGYKSHSGIAAPMAI